MKLILLTDVEKLGKKGETINVKDGYARNYLLPKNFALKSTESNIKIFENLEKLEKKKYEAEKNKAVELSKKISKISCTVRKEAGEESKIFGSVTATDIAEVLKPEGIEIDSRKIEIKDEIKTLGVYHASIKLHPEVTCEIKLWVVKA